MIAPQINQIKLFSMKATVYAIISCALFAGGIFVGIKWPQHSISRSDETITLIRAGQHKLINPLIGFEVPESLGLKRHHKLETQLRSLVADWKANHMVTDVSIYFRRLNSGTWFAVNEDEPFAPASMLKTALMMEYLYLAESNAQILSHTIVYDGHTASSDGDTTNPFEKLHIGTSYTVSDLIGRMIRNSDNNATDLLLNAGIVDPLRLRVFTSLNVPAPSMLNYGDFMSTKTYSIFFRALYNATYLNRELSEGALELLSKSGFIDGIVSGVPSTLTVAHKFGYRTFPGDTMRELHDCGIIYYPSHPYFLCVMTKGSDFDVLANVIKKISEVVYFDIQNTPLKPAPAG